MRAQEYQGLAMRTSPEGHDRVLNGCLGLIGEAGEIVDLVKKWRFQSFKDTPFPKEKLVEECGDVLWYCAELLQGLGWDVGKLWESAYAHLVPRANIPDIATAAARIARAAVKPFNMIYEVPISERTRHQRAIEMTGEVMYAVYELLRYHCATNIETAMAINIGKLRKRYPDGFDPERSMNRNE